MSVIPGTNGNDELIGGADNDSLGGGLGDDVLVGGAGNDTLDGGEGFDFADYSRDGRTVGVTIDLVQGRAWQGTGNPPVDGEVDTLISIEDAMGTIHADRFIGTASGEESFFGGLGNDTMSGGTGFTASGLRAVDALNYHRGYSDAVASKGITARFSQDVEGSGTVTFNDGLGSINAEAGTDTFDGIERVRGTAGNDIFLGGAGYQSFRGLAGNDYFDGGAGYDSVDYRRDPVTGTGIVVDLQLNTATDTSGNIDTLLNIEEIRGSSSNDLIKGNDLSNNFFGEEGNDTLQGGGGSDVLRGGSGDDLLFGGLGFSDYIEGGGGNDTIYGGHGTDGGSNTNDVAAYVLPPGTVGTLSIAQTSATTAVVRLTDSSLVTDIFQITHLGGNSFEVKDLRPGSPLGTDIVRNVDEIQFFDSGVGGNTTFAKLQVGVSVYGAGNGNFFIEGGILDNRIDVSFVVGATTASNIDAKAGRGNDIVFGHNGRNSLSGEDGNDALYGRGGNDTLNGNSGLDRLDGGAANDVMNGGAGKDIFIFSSKLGTSKTDRKVNFDTINDFSVRDDSIWLDNAMFKKLGKKGSELKPAKLDKKFFAVGDKAKDKDDYIVYNKKTGVLSYDADGSGKGQAVEFALLKNKVALKIDDLFVI